MPNYGLVARTSVHQQIYVARDGLRFSGRVAPFAEVVMSTLCVAFCVGETFGTECSFRVSLWRNLHMQSYTCVACLRVRVKYSFCDRTDQLRTGPRRRMFWCCWRVSSDLALSTKLWYVFDRPCNLRPCGERALYTEITPRNFLESGPGCVVP